jgi:hypothetical protein
VDAPLSADTRDRILSTIPEALAAIERALVWYKTTLVRYEEEAATFGNFRSAFMGLVDRAGNVDTTTAGCGSWTPTATCSRIGSTRGPTRTTSARRGTVVVPEVDLLEDPLAIRTGSTGSAHSPG